MDGLDILSKTQIYEANTGINIILVIVCCLLLFAGFYLAIEHKHIFVKAIGVILACASFISIMVLIETPIRYNTGKYEYKVTISKKVSLIEFNEKYEIIVKDGDLYTIKDK